MANLTLSIPDGAFCSDLSHLGCLYKSHNEGYHSCSVFHESIGLLTTFSVNGEKRRAYVKCPGCRDAMENDKGNGITVDKL
jgi:hypothetical protein